MMDTLSKAAVAVLYTHMRRGNVAISTPSTGKGSLLNGNTF